MSIKELSESDYQNSDIQAITKDIYNSKTTLALIVENIGPNLTNTDLKIRIHALKFLADIIGELTNNYFNTNEIAVIFSYFSKFISDHHSIAPISLKIFDKLVKLENCDGEIAIKILKCIFNEVVVQTLKQEDRMLVYRMFNWIINNNLNDIQKIRAEFIMGIIQSCDSEKDPRNLIIIFDLVAVIGKNLKLESQAEELFEIVACYFPIDFTPPPGIDEALTRNELALHLEKSLSSVSFAPFLLPFILEKFSSSVPSVKIDSINVLISVLHIYDAQVFKEYISPIWAQIKNDIYVVKKDIEVKLLDLLKLIITKLASNEATKNETLVRLFEDIYEDCGKHLYKPEAAFYFEPSSKLVLTIIRDHPLSAKYLISNLLPTFIKDFQNHETNYRITVSEFLLNVLKPESKGIGITESIAAYENQLYSLFKSILKSDNVQLRANGFQGFVCILSLKSSKELNNEENIYNEDVCTSDLNHLSLFNENSKTKEQDLTGNFDDMETVVDFICIESNTIVKTKCLECFPWTLPNLALDIKKKLVLSIINNMIVTDSEILKSFLLDVILSLSPSLTTIGYANGIIKNFLLLYLKDNGHLSSNQILTTKECITYFRKLFENYHILSEMKNYKIEWLQFCLKILESIFESQITSFNGILCAYIVSEISVIFSSVYKNIHIKSGNESELNLIEELVQNNYENMLGRKKYFWPIICSIVCSINIEIDIPYIMKLLKLSLETALSLKDDFNISTIASQVSASIINKLKDSKELEILLKEKEDHCFKIFNTFTKDIDLNENDKKICEQAIILWCWLSKALIMKNHRRQTTYCNQLVDMLIWPGDFGKLGTDGFRIIMEPHTYVLTIPTSICQTLMFKQRFFSLSINRLVGSFEICSKEKKINHIIAMSHMMKFLEMSVIQMELNSILPILIASLSIDDDDTIKAVLNNFYNISKASPQLLVDYFEDILPIILDLLKHSKMKVRLSAIECISSFSCISTHLTLRNKNKTIKCLLPLLDDKKRFVRTAASKARSQWCILGE